MREFAYERAADVAGAVAAVAGDPAAAFLGGGTNLVDHMKLGVARPARLVDVTGLPLAAIEPLPGGGLRIGAEVRNSDLAAEPLVREGYPALSRALLSGASGQLRNLATTAGNLLQRTRCVYFQDITTPCEKRDPGSGCSAVDGYTRAHAVLGGSPHCVAVHPSDMAVALAALDAEIEVHGTAGQRSIPIDDFYRLPGDAPQRDTILEHGELITAVTLPPLRTARRSTYRKVRDRASYAFALVSVAAGVAIETDGTIADIRIALGGVAHKPWRARQAEGIIRGQSLSPELLREAGAAEFADARPLRDNGFKVEMACRTIASVLTDLAAEPRA